MLESDYSNKKNVLRLALFVGELLLSNGAETYRIEDTMKRICKSRGFNYINIFISPTSIIISDARFDGITFLTVIKERNINLNKIVLFNDFSRKFVSNTSISVDEAIDELKNINNNAFIYSNITNYIATAFGCAGFAYIIGGNNPLNFLLTAITSIIVFISYKKTMSFSGLSAFSSLVAAIIVTMIAIFFTEINLVESPTTMIVGAIMPLLSGVTFVKGIRDLVTGDLMSGGARISEACLIAISVATGVGLILDTWIKLGGVL